MLILPILCYALTGLFFIVRHSGMVVVKIRLHSAQRCITFGASSVFCGPKALEMVWCPAVLSGKPPGESWSPPYGDVPVTPIPIYTKEMLVHYWGMDQYRWFREEEEAQEEPEWIPIDWLAWRVEVQGQVLTIDPVEPVPVPPPTFGSKLAARRRKVIRKWRRVKATMRSTATRIPSAMRIVTTRVWALGAGVVAFFPWKTCLVGTSATLLLERLLAYVVRARRRGRAPRHVRQSDLYPLFNELVGPDHDACYWAAHRYMAAPRRADFPVDDDSEGPWRMVWSELVVLLRPGGAPG